MNKVLVQTKVKDLNHFNEHFKKAIEPLESSYPEWLFNLKLRALEQFNDIGFPAQDDEDWRFTNISPIEKIHWKIATKQSVQNLPEDILKNVPFLNIKSNRLVFVNGFYIPELSMITEELGFIGNLENFIKGDSDTLKKIYDESGLALNDAFCALNMALSTDGALILIPPNIKLSKPVHIVHISLGSDSSIMSVPQHIISVGRHSNLILFETYSNYSADTTFTNAFTRIIANNGAVVEHIRCQTENQNSYNIATTQSCLGESVQLSLFSIALGGKISRHTIKSRLNGEGIESVFGGIYMASDSQLNDHYLVVEHIKPRCISYEYFNGILSDKARGVFNGRIYVHPNAIKTDAKQTNKNLLLSDDAVINSKPQLEIYADDVKCTHGATVGRLDQNAIFYLRSRGININDARRMLIWAFASEILDHINNQECREKLEKIVADWLSSHFANI